MKRLHVELLVLGVVLEVSFHVWRHRPVAESATGALPVAALYPPPARVDPPLRYSATVAQMVARVDGRDEALPLRRTEVDAEVAGVMSSVRVHQVYENHGANPIEAVYVFPLPHGAAVHAMTMQVGQRRVVAEIGRRDEARNTYEAARAHGQTAALLEQERPDVFTWNVANIQPGDTIDVVLEYVQELSPVDGRYSWVFPMTVGPRNLGHSVAGSPPEDNARLTPAYAPPDQRPGNDVGVTLRLRTAVPARDIVSPTHAVRVEPLGAGDDRVVLDARDRIANRDLVVSWALAGERPRATVLAREDAVGSGHFLLMVQPTARPHAEDIAPRDYVFVVDSSGSMEGWPLDLAKSALRRCLGSMRGSDRFQVVQFAGSARAFSDEPVVASPAEVQRALAWVGTFDGSGGTEFIPALELAMGRPRDPERARIVVFMTDGYIGEDSAVLAWLHAHAGRANVFAMGVGTAVNRELIDGMARVGHGEPYVLLGTEGSDAVVDRMFATISRPALTDVTLRWDGVAVSDVNPTAIPDLFADRPIVVTGRYAAGGSGHVTVRGRVGGRSYEEVVPVTFDGRAQEGTHPALAYLWARRRIDALMDDRAFAAPEYRAPIEAQVTQLALDHHLMSEWTSFVAVDRYVRGPSVAPARVEVPAQMPVGVSPTVALSRDQIVPGDPEIAVLAPAGARRVTVVLPDGGVAPCTYDARRGRWVTNFVVPTDAPDGVYAVRVLITLADGSEQERTARYQVDALAPEVTVALDARVARGAEVTLRVLPSGGGSALPPVDFTDVGATDFDARVRRAVETVEARLPDGTVRAATRDADGAYSLRFRAPLRAGEYRVDVVARDAAGNATRRAQGMTVTGG
jgi:Ca-activated chloride channel family protein